MSKKVYVLFTENSWRGIEEYSDVIDVFENESDAIKALEEEKNEFIEDNKEDFGEDVSKNPYYDVTDRPTHFQCLDEGMGYNYELWVLEKDLK